MLMEETTAALKWGQLEHTHCIRDLTTSAGQTVSHARFAQIAPCKNGGRPPGTICFESCEYRVGEEVKSATVNQTVTSASPSLTSVYTEKDMKRKEFRSIVMPTLLFVMSRRDHGRSTCRLVLM